MNFELGEGVTCDLTKLLVSRLLIQANSGGGKSRTIRRILEQTYGHVQQIILDTEGEFATLREKFDYIYAAKSGGDTAVEPRAAKLLAERLLKLGVSAILDLSELKATPRIQFVRYFLEALMEAPKELWHPVLIILDEGHTYCPQNGEAESAAAVIDTATRGRKRSFCLIIATQRLSKLHKDAAAELNNKMIGRTGLDVDMNRAADELGFATKDQKRELRALEPGRFFIFGPALPVGVNTVLMGPVQTRHPEPGSKLAFTPPPPTAKIKALLPQLKDLPAEAEERHKSFEDVRKENAQLRRQLTLAERAAPTKVETKVVQSRVEVPVLTPADLRRLETAAEKISKVGADVTAVVHTLNVRIYEIGKGAPGKAAPTVVQAPHRTVTQVKTTRPAPAPAATVPVEGLTGPEQRILDAIAWCESIAILDPEKPAVAFLAGYTYGGGAFGNPCGMLRRKGLVRYLSGDRIALTEEGRSLADGPEQAATNAALQEAVLDALPRPEAKILRVLLEDGAPKTLAKAELAERAGYSPEGGAFGNPLGRLRSLGLVDYPEKNHARARDLLFPEGV